MPAITVPVAMASSPSSAPTFPEYRPEPVRYGIWIGEANGRQDAIDPPGSRCPGSVRSVAGLITGRFRRRAEKHFAGQTVLREDDANSFGVESAGKWQVRGNGNLALTKHELLFAQWVPNRLVRIPRDSIIEVTTARSHLGKTMGRKLLKVVWTTEVGTQDSIALWVKDLGGWLEALGPDGAGGKSGTSEST